MYGVVHRPAQVVRWAGGLLQNEAAPLGQALIRLSSEIDMEAYHQLEPYVPPLPGLTFGPPPGPPVPCSAYTPAPPEPWWGTFVGWSAYWIPDGAACPGGPGYGPGHWQVSYAPPI